VRWSQDDAVSENVSYTYTLQPGKSNIIVPTGILMSANLYSNDGSGATNDAVFVADGAFAYYDDAMQGNQSVITTFSTAGYGRVNVANYPADAFILAGGAHLAGRVDRFVKLFRTLTTNAQPIDMSSDSYVSFKARGVGDVYVMLEKSSIKDYNYHAYKITLTNDFKTYTIPFTAFKPWQGGNVPFTANDLNVISFSVNSTATGTTPFEIEAKNIFFSGSGVTPVELSAFTAEPTGSGVELKWTTASEKNNYGFEVERRLGRGETETGRLGDWEKIGFVPGHGTTTATQHYRFSDKDVAGHSSLAYRLKQVDTDGKFEYSATVTVELADAKPMTFSLQQNYPNPFNPSTTIRFSLPQREFVTLEVFDVLGRRVALLVNEWKDAGNHSITFDTRHSTFDIVSSGVYYYRIAAGNVVAMKKMIVTK
jgi:hypothetical protein